MRYRARLAVAMIIALQAPMAAHATRHLDALGQEACDSFGRAMRDFGNGLVTERQLRLLIQDVDRLGQLSVKPEVGEATRAALVEITSGNAGTLAEAFRHLSAVCLGSTSRHSPAPRSSRLTG